MECNKNAMNAQGTRYKLTYDGMYHLDIPKTRQYDHGVVEVIAKNSLGEAYAKTELIVRNKHEDYRGVLKNSPRRKSFTLASLLSVNLFFWSSFLFVLVVRVYSLTIYLCVPCPIVVILLCCSKRNQKPGTIRT